ncbi:MAG: DUF4920 domain-containing protein [Balneolaceae bacterium]|nr:DUF4920 domain-containing protein [Balneolaceae bacterium]
MKYFVCLFFAVICLAGSLHAQNANQDYVQLSDPVEQTDEYRVFGSRFDRDMRTVAMVSLIAQSGEYDGKTIATEGTITQVCQKKGCFFMLESDDREQQARISFKDYNFFIPTNTAGSKVQINGTFSVKTISEEDAKHYAEDAGNNPELISGSQKEYSLVATSVKIYK